MLAQKKVNIFDTEYTFQKVKPRAWLQIRQRTKDKHGMPIEEKLYSEILEHIVIVPKKTIDDFEEIEELEEVMKEAIRFQCHRKQDTE